MNGLLVAALAFGSGCSVWGDLDGHYALGALSGAPVGKRVAAGISFTCAIAGTSAPGQVRCWGANEVGQLGRGAASDSEGEPADVLLEEATELGDATPLNDATWIDAAGNHACALTGGGQVYCWGDALGFYSISGTPA